MGSEGNSLQRHENQKCGATRIAASSVSATNGRYPPLRKGKQRIKAHEVPSSLSRRGSFQTTPMPVGVSAWSLSPSNMIRRRRRLHNYSTYILSNLANPSGLERSLTRQRIHSTARADVAPAQPHKLAYSQKQDGDSPYQSSCSPTSPCHPPPRGYLEAEA